MSSIYNLKQKSHAALFTWLIFQFCPGPPPYIFKDIHCTTPTAYFCFFDNIIIQLQVEINEGSNLAGGWVREECVWRGGGGVLLIVGGKSYSLPHRK